MEKFSGSSKWGLPHPPREVSQQHSLKMACDMISKVLHGPGCYGCTFCEGRNLDRP